MPGPVPLPVIQVLRRLLRLDMLGNILVLPLARHIDVDHGIAWNFLVWLGQLLEEGVYLVLKFAVAFGDRTLELLGFFVPVSRLIDLTETEARNNIVTGQGFDLTARDILHNVACCHIGTGRTTDTIAPDGPPSCPFR